MERQAKKRKAKRTKKTADLIPIKRQEGRDFTKKLFPNATPEATDLISGVLGIVFSMQTKPKEKGDEAPE